MARPLRIERPGRWYHFANRGVERRAIYSDDRDRRRELALFEEAVPSPWDHVLARVILDGRGFMDKARSRIAGSTREQPQRRAMAKRPTGERVVSVVQTLRGEQWDVF